MKNVVPSSILTEEVIEQLVDGQLAGDRYREVLRALDESSDGWRKCAIVFLEEQALAQELQRLSRSGFNFVCERPANVPRQPASPTPLQLVREDRFESSKSMWKLASKLNVLSLAASVVLAFSVGWFGAGLRESRIGGTGIDATDSQAGLATMSSVGAEVGSSAGTVQPGSNSDNFDPRRWVFHSNESFVPLDRRIPEQLLELERRGMVQIETIDGIMPFELEDGRAAVIPVQNFRVRPVWYAY